MEYKYHPVIKYIVFFVIIFLFLKEQKTMTSELILGNTMLLTFIFVCLDFMFVHNHPSLFKSLKDQDDEIIDINDEIKLNQEKLSEKSQDSKSQDKKKITVIVKHDSIDDSDNNIDNIDDNIDKKPKRENFINSNRSNFELGNMSRTSMNRSDGYLSSEQNFNNAMNNFPEYDAYNS
jgi:septal ring factor EnvC (AmiA/AmiB activator)